MGETVSKYNTHLKSASVAAPPGYEMMRVYVMCIHVKNKDEFLEISSIQCNKNCSQVPLG
jgi:hypothetical protein